MPRQLGKSVPMRVAERLAEGILGTTATEKVEDTQVLSGSRRRIEPWLERPAPIGNLANSEPERMRNSIMVPAPPSDLQIVRPVAWEMGLVRPVGGLVEECVEETHLRGTIRRRLSRSDGQEYQRLDRSQQQRWLGSAGCDSEAFDQGLPGTQVQR